METNPKARLCAALAVVAGVYLLFGIAAAIQLLPSSCCDDQDLTVGKLKFSVSDPYSLNLNPDPHLGI